MSGPVAFISGNGTGPTQWVDATHPLPVDIGGNFSSSGNVTSTGAVTASGNVTATGNVTVNNLAGGNIATIQVVVTNGTATQIVNTRAARKSLTVTNTGNVAVYLGASGVTTGTGELLPGTVGASLTISFTGALYGIVGSGNQTVTAIEVYT